MRRFFCKNRYFRKRLTKTIERIVETIQLLIATTLQQMNEEKKEKKNEKMISVNEKSAKNIKMKKIVEKEFSKKKENSDTIIFEVVDVKNSIAQIFIKYYINDTISTSSSFTKFFFEFEKFLKEDGVAQTKAQKKINE